MTRTTRILIALLLAALTAAGCGEAAVRGPSLKTSAPTFKAPSPGTALIFKSPELQFQMLRSMGASTYGAADIGECLVAAMQVDEGQLTAGDFDSWYKAWNGAAERLMPVAEECLARGDKVSARDTYLRCNTYYNMAEFYLHGDPSDARIYDASSRARQCFKKAAGLMDPPAEDVKIKYGKYQLPGYFYRVDTSGRKRPLLILQTGFDGTKEELYAEGARAALDRGYNVLTFEGPGQGEVLREQKLYFTKDWHKVITPVVDYATSRKDVDPKNISLWGISMGGCLTARAAACEHRIKALILDPAMDISDTIMSSFGKGILEMSDGTPTKEGLKAILEKYPGQADQGLEEMMKVNLQANWYLQNGMFAFGVGKPAEFLLKQMEYTSDDLAAKITAKTLVCDAEQDAEKFGSMTHDIYDNMTCPKEYFMFTNAQGAGAHCQMGAFRFGAQVKLDFLDRATGNR